MDRSQAREYRERWRIVNQLTDTESRNASVHQRWHQFIALQDAWCRLGRLPAPTDVSIVRERWARLRRES